MPSPRFRRRTGGADDYFDADPKAPDRTYARRGGFLEPGRISTRWSSASPPATWKPPTPRSCWAWWSPRQALTDAGYGRRIRDFNRDRVSVILGVTGTLELVIPLGARLGHPIWRQAPGRRRASPTRRPRRRPPDRRVLRALAGELVPRPARQRRRRPHRQPARPRRHQLRRRCRLRQLARRRAPGRAGTVPPAAPTWRVTGGVDTFNDIFMYMCFSKTPALSPTGDARPFDAAGDGTILGEGLGMVVLKRLADAGATATGSTR